jgi:hypothetical protein
MTEAGRVVLEAQGLHVHAVASVVQDLGDAGADDLLTSVRALGTALEARRPGEGAPPAL